MFMTGLTKKQELYVAELQRGLTLPRFGFRCAELTAWGKTWHRSDAEDPYGAKCLSTRRIARSRCCSVQCGHSWQAFSRCQMIPI